MYVSSNQINKNVYQFKVLHILLNFNYKLNKIKAISSPCSCCDLEKETIEKNYL